jgi:hypothetical protein
MKLYRRRTVFEKEKPRHQRLIESEFERSVSHLKSSSMGSEEYVKTLTVSERLYGMMDIERRSSVSKETLVTVGANLLGILMIIKHENVNVITSKALGFILRPKI